MTRHNLFLAILCSLSFLLPAGSAIGQSAPAKKQAKSDQHPAAPLITFIELGSVNCIPCRQMQPVMASIGKKYEKQIKVVFYDVWKPETRHYANTYGIRVIPTQVFLNQGGKEIYRHEGFFPEAEIDKLLQKHGLKLRSGG